MKKHFNKNFTMSDEEEHVNNKVTVAGFVKNVLTMVRKK